MAVRSRSTLKTYFETQDQPTQAQFWDWLDSYVHKNDLIPVENVQGLQELLAGNGPIEVTVSGSATYQLQAGVLLQNVVFQADGSGPLKIGTTVGGGQIIDTTVDDGNNVISVQYYANGATTLHITGTGTAILFIVPGSSLLPLDVPGSEVTYTLGAGKLVQSVLFVAATSGTFTVGSTTGGSEYINQSVTAGVYVFAIPIYASSETTLYINGPNGTVKLYIR
jgi:hypothetical protein